MYLAEIQVKYVPHKYSSTKVTQSSVVLDIAKQVWNKDLLSYQESFLAFFLNRSNKVLGYRFMFTGGIHTAVDVRHCTEN